MEGVITDIEEAKEAGDPRVVWGAVNHLDGSSKRPEPKQPSKSPAGEEIRSSEELAEACRAFCAGTKFACTEAESRRPDSARQTTSSMQCTQSARGKLQQQLQFDSSNSSSNGSSNNGSNCSSDISSVQQ